MANWQVLGTEHDIALFLFRTSPTLKDALRKYRAQRGICIGIGFELTGDGDARRRAERSRKKIADAALESLRRGGIEDAALRVAALARPASLTDGEIAREPIERVSSFEDARILLALIERARGGWIQLRAAIDLLIASGAVIGFGMIHASVDLYGGTVLLIPDVADAYERLPPDQRSEILRLVMEEETPKAAFIDGRPAVVDHVARQSFFLDRLKEHRGNKTAAQDEALAEFNIGLDRWSRTAAARTRPPAGDPVILTSDPPRPPEPPEETITVAQRGKRLTFTSEQEMCDALGLVRRVLPSNDVVFEPRKRRRRIS